MTTRACANRGAFVRWALGLAWLVTMPLETLADSTTLIPVADGEIADEPTDGIFDTVDTTGLSIEVESLSIGTPAIRRGALEFDLSSIPIGATIESATLRLTRFGGTAPSRIDAHGYVADGVVDLSDATRSATLAGQTFWSSLPATVPVDVTGYVESLVSRGEPLLGLNLRTDESSANASLRFGASELASDPPRLEVVWDATGPPVAPHFWQWLPVLDDGYATDDPTDGVFDSLTTSGSSLVAQSTFSTFLSRFVTKRALLEIDLSALAPTAPILSASLVLDASQLKTGGSPAVFELYGYEGDGVVVLADADAGSVLVDSVSVDSVIPPVAFDVASLLASLTQAGAPVAGFNLRSALDGTSSGSGHDEMITVGSQESTSPVRERPRLIVETGVPAVVPLLGVAPAVCLTLGIAGAWRASLRKVSGFRRKRPRT